MSFDGESGGHYYYEDGRPCYSIIGKNGNERAVWISDARALKLKPSATTIIQEAIPAPGLVNYYVEQAVDAALTLTRLPGEGDKEFKKRIRADSKAAAKAAADEGTRIHNAIEDHFASRPVPDIYKRHVTATVAEIRKMYPEIHDWVSEKSFAHPLGFGGKVDLHSPSTGIVIDYKGKDGEFVLVGNDWCNMLPTFDKPKKLAWSQNIQLAAYQVGLCLHDCIAMQDESQFVYSGYYHTRCANIFVSRTHPGKVCSHVWSADEIAYGWEIFSAALTLWKRLKKYDASW